MSNPELARVALITGGAQGIGEAIALRLAEDGIDIVVLDLPGKEELLTAVVKKVEGKGRKAMWLTGDVTSEESTKSAIEKVVNTFGSLDIMVANAGILRLGLMTETTVEDWDALFAVNSKGVMLSYKYAAIQMIKQGRGGRIIGACSTAGKVGVRNLSAYCATKFAVRGLTQAAAVELLPHGITVNCYAPGYINTPMVTLPGDEDNGVNGSAIRMMTGVPETVAKLQLPSPDTVAELVAYIAKPSSSILTGQNIALNNGYHMD